MPGTATSPASTVSSWDQCQLTQVRGHLGHSLSPDRSPCTLELTLTPTLVHCVCVCVCVDEEGVTVTLERFDPGRDQPGSSGRVPSTLLPGDILVPCMFSAQTEMSPEGVIQSEAELHQCFKVSLNAD